MNPSSPDIGQGASLALEDTVVIAEFLKLYKDHKTAFQIFPVQTPA